MSRRKRPFKPEEMTALEVVDIDADFLMILTPLLSAVTLIQNQSLKLSQMASLMLKKKRKLLMIFNITGKVNQLLAEPFPLWEIVV